MSDNQPVPQPPTPSPAPEGVATLRARWDPVAAAFPKHLRYEGICARMYRAFSWLERVEQLAADEGQASADDQLIFSWTALNSLYGCWDDERREPLPDMRSLVLFTDQLFGLDENGALKALLESRRREVMAVFDNQFLARQFWNAPDIDRADDKTRLRHKAGSWYFEKCYPLLLEKLLLNVYYLRCQLIHGAATRNSSLNRDTLGECLRALRLVLPVMLGILVENGKDEDWGLVCYPVVK